MSVVCSTCGEDLFRFTKFCPTTGEPHFPLSRSSSASPEPLPPEDDLFSLMIDDELGDEPSEVPEDELPATLSWEEYEEPDEETTLRELGLFELCYPF
jgi:hypothetical protein